MVNAYRQPFYKTGQRSNRKGFVVTDKLMTIEEVAEATRLSVATLRWLRHNKRGPVAATLGRRLVYRESDVQKWIDEQFAGSAA